MYVVDVEIIRYGPNANNRSANLIYLKKTYRYY